MPLGEESERYEIDILDGATVMRTLSARLPDVTYTAAQQIADFGAAQPASRSARLSAQRHLRPRHPPRKATV